MSTSPINRWSSAEHALEYLGRADKVPHRTEGEAELLTWLPDRMNHVLDLGSGDGRLLGLVQAARPETTAVALDFSPTMLDKLRARFATDSSVTVVAHNLEDPLPSLGKFDAVVSSFAIHHLPDIRKRALYGEIYQVLNPGGVFCNLEHVASPNQTVHIRFLEALGIGPDQEDPSNILLDMETQLQWLREVGFLNVDCHWKWRELALLAGTK